MFIVEWGHHRRRRYVVHGGVSMGKNGERVGHVIICFRFLKTYSINIFAEVFAQKPETDPSDPGCYLMSPVYGRMIFID